ncbi:MAG TPA: helix-turn-helix domain-containing protein [Verrucomicrobium sp.]|nr:helix-turn-helix domain-containing protein [Verrucomicrobium sp.]
MRPLSHPSVKDITVEGILHAFSDPVRVQIFADILQSACPRTCSDFLVIDNRALPKSTLSQHFKVLRESGLIRSERKGVEMHNTTRCVDFKDRFGPLVTSILEAYCEQNRAAKSRKKPA